jgi:hypothetical protein
LLRLWQCDLPKVMGEDQRLAQSEYTGAALGDQRLNTRLQTIAATLEANPDVGFPHAMTEAELEAFYRFLSNERVEPDAILAPHVEATVERCEGLGTVPCVHDTTVFKFNTPREGLGEYAGRTLFAHVAMAVGAAGVPLGVLGMHPWARSKDTVTQRQKRGEFSKAKAIELSSEQDRWLLLMDQVEEKVGRSRALHVMDSEADDYHVLRTLVERKSRFIIRAAGNRRLQADDDEPAKLRDFVSSSPVVCTRSVPLSKRQKTRFRVNTKQKLPRESRQATLSIGAGTVEIRAPNYYSKASAQTVPLHVVWVREVDVSEGIEPVEWTLMTTEPIETEADILAVVDSYRHRWGIEELSKALKTGCAYEKRQLGSYQTLVNALALLLPIAWNLLRLRTLARDDRKLPASAVLSSVELQVLHHAAEKPLPNKPTLREAMLAIARLGGHLKRNGEPGWLVLGRGYLKLLDLAQGFLIAKRCDQS